MLRHISDRIYKWASLPVWTANLGLARTLIALSGLGTLLFSSVNTLIRPAAGTSGMFCAGPASASVWCLTPVGYHEWAKLACILILAVAASGWRPRLTAIPMWWVLFGSQSSLTVIDGGDQIASVLALLLLPISLTDSRTWHWTQTTGETRARRPRAAVVAHVSLVVLQIQVSFVYLNSCLAKLGVPEWRDGTAVYYWLRDPMFGPAGTLRNVTDVLMAQQVPVAVATWGTLALEFFLGISILLPSRFKLALLPLGVMFHLGIAVMMGLWSFAFVMWAALLIALWPTGNLVGMVKRVLSRRFDRRKNLKSGNVLVHEPAQHRNYAHSR